MIDRSLVGVLYNCRAGRKPATVKANLIQLLDEHRPAFVLLSECAGYIAVLSLLPGYRLVIHDRCGTGILVRNDVEAKFASVHPLGRLPWPFRANAGRPLKWHPRRAICKAIIDGWLDAVSVHMVPAPDTNYLRTAAYQAGLHRLAKYADDRSARPLLMGGDWNKPGRQDGPDTPRRLAARISTETAHADLTYEPGNVLYVLSRKCAVTNLGPIGNYGSDHEAVLFTVHRPALTKEKAA